jgi:putative sterol carrier protein
MPRATSVQEVFDKLPQAFVPEEARGFRAVVQFDLTGPGGGEWNATINDGQLSVSPGRAANPTLTLGATAADYLAIINGDLKAMSAFMTGRVKVKGDLNTALKMQKMFRMPEDGG